MHMLQVEESNFKNWSHQAIDFILGRIFSFQLSFLFLKAYATLKLGAISTTKSQMVTHNPFYMEMNRSIYVYNCSYALLSFRAWGVISGHWVEYTTVSSMYHFKTQILPSPSALGL